MLNVILLGLYLIGFLVWCVIGDALIQMQERIARRKEDRNVRRGFQE